MIPRSYKLIATCFKTSELFYNCSKFVHLSYGQKMISSYISLSAKVKIDCTKARKKLNIALATNIATAHRFGGLI